MAVVAVMAVAAVLSGSGGVPSAEPSQAISWNKHVTARPVYVTIPEILGTTVDALGGATWSGGWYSGVSLAEVHPVSAWRLHRG